MKPVSMRGFDIRFQRAGDDWPCQKSHGYAPVGELPAEWEAVKADPSVLSAEIFLSSERRKQSHKRKLAASFTRSVA